MKTRIKYIRKSVGLNQTEFGERIGETQTSIAKYESGTRIPRDAVIRAIEREFNINDEWMRTGIGPMFKQPIDGEDFEVWYKRVKQGVVEWNNVDVLKMKFLKSLAKISDDSWNKIFDEFSSILNLN